jgi:hypothetical protein
MNIGLTEDLDIAIVDGGLWMVTGKEEIRQLLIQKLLRIKGEWFLDLDDGLEYFEVILEKGTSLADIEAIYINEIISTPGVIDINEFNLIYNPTTRQADITCQIDTVDGEINFTTLEAP